MFLLRCPCTGSNESQLKRLLSGSVLSDVADLIMKANSVCLGCLQYTIGTCTISAVWAEIVLSTEREKSRDLILTGDVFSPKAEHRMDCVLFNAAVRFGIK